MNRYLITGVSSGIGRALTKKLIGEGNIVWGIARREGLLKDLKKEVVKPNNFNYSKIDISEKDSWKILVTQMKKANFIPEIIIFNAAINKYDFLSGIDTSLTKEMFNINLFGILDGINILMGFVKPKTQFIAISSSSALKGSGVEGVGYPSSKAALSISFESLYQRYKGKYFFKTIYFGPINSGMVPFKNNSLFLLTEEKAISKILQVVKKNKAIYYCPRILFLLVKIIQLMPSKLYFIFLDYIDKNHLKNSK